MVNEIYKEEFANILLFLTHLSQEDYIVNALLASANEVYKSNELARLETEIGPLNTLISELLETKYLDGQEAKVRNERLQAQDDIESSETEADETAAPVIELNQALKTLQILGQMLKITVGVGGIEHKYEVARVCNDLGLRTITGIMDLVLGSKEELLRVMYEMLRRQYGVQATEQSPLLNEKMRRDAQVILVCLAHDICYGLVKRISASIGTPDLELVFRRIRTESNSAAT
jgi:hypothetical protein